MIIIPKELQYLTKNKDTQSKQSSTIVSNIFSPNREVFQTIETPLPVKYYNIKDNSSKNINKFENPEINKVQ